MSVTVITQPNYLPWLGYFEQVVRADTFIVLDCVQFEKREWQNRNRLKGSNGSPFWLTVPVQKAERGILINNVKIAERNQGWCKKHLQSIERHLRSAPYFKDVYSTVSTWLQIDYETLLDLNLSGIKLFAQLLGIQTTFVLASELAPVGRKTELLVDLCRKTNANVYYSSLGAKEYMLADEHMFAEAGISLQYQRWQHPEYRQLYGTFVSHLSIIDALANVGVCRTKEMITEHEIKD